MIKDDRLPLKEKFLTYFKDVPMQKFSAMHIGISEDTVCDWKNKDPDFANRIDELKAEFVRMKLEGVKDMEWKLERMFKQEFAQRTEHTGADGKDLPAPILNGLSHNDSNNKDIPTNKKN